MNWNWKSFVAGALAAVTLLFVINQTPGASVSSYQIVTNPTDSGLALLVNREIAKGWTPMGGPAIGSAGLSQALVK